MAQKRYILHMFTPTANVSPFDVNMAADAGWDTVMPYTALESGDIAPLTQDAIFSRGPSGVKRTGIFIGGRDMRGALEMLDAARKAMVPPFEVSVMADPSGAFTTAAGMIAAVGGALEAAGAGWQSRRVLVPGGTGPVGMAVSVLAAQLGAEVTIMSRAQEKADKAVAMCQSLVDGKGSLSGSGQDRKAELLSQTEVLLATAAAGIEVMSADEVTAAARLKVAADVNAVPPSGIAGLDVMSSDTVLPASPSSAIGVGALAIGNIKYQSQHRLLKQMRESDAPLCLHYEDACRAAQEYVAEKQA